MRLWLEYQITTKVCFGGNKMKKSILDLFTRMGKRLDGPTFFKEFEDSSKLISELEAIASDIKDVAVKEDIAMDIVYIKAGDQGEKNVYYELKNSFIPMIILHNVVIQYDDYKAQMDFILITHRFICVLETKKLNGNIQINTDGDFVRSFTNKSGKVYKKEGMYSPISQNQRHVRILENLMLQEKVIKRTPVLSLVVIANPKSIIDFKFAKKEVKDQIVKYDQLTPRIKKMLEMKSDVELMTTSMIRMSDFLVEQHVTAENAWVTKYNKYLAVDYTDTQATYNQTDELNKLGEVIEEKINSVKEEIAEVIENEIDKETIRKALVKFRLEQSRLENIKAYIIFNNNQLDVLLDKMPKSKEELMKCQGFGADKVKKYGEQILKLIS
jgi:hypothetical protein